PSAVGRVAQMDCCFEAHCIEFALYVRNLLRQVAVYKEVLMVEDERLDCFDVVVLNKKMLSASDEVFSEQSLFAHGASFVCDHAVEVLRCNDRMPDVSVQNCGVVVGEAQSCCNHQADHCESLQFSTE